MKSSFSFLHFNDCYNLEEANEEPVGGVSRFTTLLHQYQKEKGNPISTFGGDGFSPSTSKSLPLNNSFFLNLFFFFNKKIKKILYN